MISIEFLVSLAIGAAALILAVYGRRRQNGTVELSVQLKATADFLLAQNQALSTQLETIRTENQSLHSEIRQLRIDLGDARALLRNLQPRP